MNDLYLINFERIRNEIHEETALQARVVERARFASDVIDAEWADPRTVRSIFKLADAELAAAVKRANTLPKAD